MNTEVISRVSKATLAGEVAFPELVQLLLAAGVEYYHIDYLSGRKRFYGAGDEVVETAITFENLPPVAAEFNQPAVKAAIVDSQLHGQKYRAFTRRAMEAGVMGYYAFLTGGCVTYFGRLGCQHTEWFPGRGPEAEKSE